MQNPSELWNITCHMGSHLSPNTGEHAPPNRSQAGQYGTYLSQRNGRL